MNNYQREINCMKRTVVAIEVARHVISANDHTEEFMKGWESAHDIIIASLCHVVEELEERGEEDEENPEGRA